MRTDLVGRTRSVLEQAGFALSDPHALRPATFDLVARRENTLLLVKVFTNADSLGEDLADELRMLAGLLDAAPLLLGERSSAGPLEDGVLYVRHRVPVVTLGTLEGALVRDEPPLVYAAPGGYYVNLDGMALRALREARRVSLGQLAEVAGVSRRAIAMYEEGMSALVEVAERLEEFFQEPVARPVDVFQRSEPRETPELDPSKLREALLREVLGRLCEIGYKVAVTQRAPFQAVSQDAAHKTLFLTGVADLEQGMAERARMMQSIASVVEREVAIFVRDRRSREDLQGLALIDQRELARMDESEQVLALIRERTRPARPGD